MPRAIGMRFDPASAEGLEACFELAIRDPRGRDAGRASSSPSPTAAAPSGPAARPAPGPARSSAPTTSSCWPAAPPAGRSCCPAAASSCRATRFWRCASRPCSGCRCSSSPLRDQPPHPAGSFSQNSGVKRTIGTLVALAALGVSVCATAQAAAVKLTRARIAYSHLEADAPNAFTFRLNRRARVRIVLRRGRRRIGLLRGTRGRGAGRIAFGGKVRGRPLRAGRYVASLSAGGSRVSRVRFRIIRSPAGAGCAGSSWFAGTTDICRGVLDYRDYVYDDYGADTGGVLTKTTGDLSPSAGDQTYPAGQANTADLVGLKLWVAHRRLHISALVNTLYKSSSTIVAVALDTRGGASPGGRWPGLDVSSSGWDHVYELRRGDPAANTFTATEPLPAGTRWRVQAVTAQSDGTVMNVAFRGPDEQARFGGTAIQDASGLSDVGSWFEDQQAAALHSGDISRFGYTVNVADLEQAASQTTPVGRRPARARLHQRVHAGARRGDQLHGSARARPRRQRRRSRPASSRTGTTSGATSRTGSTSRRASPPYGLQMYYHGTGANFTSQINQAGMQARFGDALHRILAAPLARGPRRLFVGHLRARRARRDGRCRVALRHRPLAGVLQRLLPGRLHRVLHGRGVSAAVRRGRCLGRLHRRRAQRDAGQGHPGPVVHGGRGRQRARLRSIAAEHPDVRCSTPGEDELVHDQTSTGMDRAFAGTPNIYTWYLHPAGEHLTYIVLDDWRKEAADTAQPAPGARTPCMSGSCGTRTPTARRTGSGTTPRTGSRASSTAPPASTGRWIRPTTGAAGRSRRRRPATARGPTRSRWVSDYRHQVGTTSVPAARRLTGSLTNVSSVRIDATATCLTGGPVAYSITTDGPASVAFSDGRTLTLQGSGRHTGTLPSSCPGRRSSSARSRRTGRSARTASRA